MARKKQEVQLNFLLASYRPEVEKLAVWSKKTAVNFSPPFTPPQIEKLSKNLSGDVLKINEMISIYEINFERVPH